MLRFILNPLELTNAQIDLESSRTDTCADLSGVSRAHTCSDLSWNLSNSHMRRFIWKSLSSSHMLRFILKPLWLTHAQIYIESLELTHA